MTLILLPHEMTLDDMHDLGWDDTAVDIGLQSDLSFVVSLDDDYYEYNITRHLRRSSYEKLINVKFRGKHRSLIFVVWN